MPDINKDLVLISQLFEMQPASVILMKPLFASDDSQESSITDFQVCCYNEAAAALLGVFKQAILNKSLIKDKLFKGEGESIFFEHCLHVFISNTGDEYTFFNPSLQKHLNVTGTRINDGVLCILRDITRQVIGEKKAEEQAEFLNAMLDASINAVFVCEAIRDTEGKIQDLRMIKINRAFTEMTGKIAFEAEQNNFLSLFPSAKTNGVFDLTCQVLNTGERQRKEIYYKGKNADEWIDISLVRLGDDRLLVTFTIITQEKQAILHIQHQRTLLDNILKYSPSGICVVYIMRDKKGNPVDGYAILANEAATHITGIPKEFITNKISLIDSKILSCELFQESAVTLDTGKPFSTQYFLKSSSKWLDMGISKLDKDHLIIVFTDITSSKTAQLEIEKSANQLLNFINTAHSGISHLLPAENETGELVDFYFGTTSAAFIAYAGQQPETVKGELVSKYYPSYKKNGLFEQYKYTYLTGDSCRFETHYTGENIDAWFDIMSAKMDDGVLVTLTDTTTLKKLQIDLESLVNELKKSNESLQEFAYVASHDLQEPLRKIEVFSERLQKDMGDRLTEENKRVFQRMITATQRMSQLINDLLSYSQLSTKPPAFNTINLKELIQQVQSDLEATIIEKKAKFSIGELPEVKGDPVQLRQLFQNLLSNSLKYGKEDVPPVVFIHSTIVKKEINGLLNSFYEIEIADNGIGFEQQHAERIFKVFQRLHGRSEYPGTGIGLAIVQKVIENHNGSITAESEPEKGATFKLYLPV